LISPRGRHLEALREAREGALRLERITEFKLKRGGAMAGVRRVDAEAIREDRASGLSLDKIAEKHHCARSTVAYWLEEKDDRPPEVRLKAEESSGPSGSKTPSKNGAGRKPERDELASLEQLADREWGRLPVVERLRLLLSRGAA
jgi:hypothetical protein